MGSPAVEGLKGKVAIVTGAGRGVGRGVARELASHGTKVVIADLGSSLEGDGGDLSLAESVVAEIRAAGGDAIATNTDVSNPESVAAAIKETEESFGPVDILINNAGILRPSWIWELSHDDYMAVLSVHLIGQFNCMRAVVPGMRERGYGRIVNLTSHGALGHPLQSSYSSAKAGVLGLTWASAVELEGTGVTVNAVGPAVLTRMASAASAMSDEELKAAPVSAAPLIAYLASAVAGDINGQVIMAEPTFKPGNFQLYAPPRPIAAVQRPDDELWKLEELDEVIRDAFNGSWATPGPAPRQALAAYVDKMTTLRGLPNYWAED